MKNSNQEEQALEPEAERGTIANVFKRSNRVDATQQKSFDSRIVSYEALHYVNSRDFDKLVEVIDPKEEQKILDAGAGYGAVTREILYRHLEKPLRFHLLDISAVQLERAVHELSGHFGHSRISKMEFIQDSIVHPMCKDSFFDKVAAKMVIHEVPCELQPIAFNQMYRVLKPNGKLIVWDVVPDVDTQKIIRNIIRKKDQLAGFNYLADSRYYPTPCEWLKLFSSAGFEQVKREGNIKYELKSAERLSAEFAGDESKLYEWHHYIRSLVRQVPANILKKLGYEDYGSSISIQLPKAIYSAVRI